MLGGETVWGRGEEVAACLPRGEAWPGAGGLQHREKGSPSGVFSYRSPGGLMLRYSLPARR